MGEGTVVCHSECQIDLCVSESHVLFRHSGLNPESHNRDGNAIAGHLSSQARTARNDEEKPFNPSTVKLLNHSSLKKGAFTLAEVLITLGIIGVVAAMTLPTLIAQNQKKTAITQLKKAYSEFAQAVNTAQVEHGMMDSWDFSAYNVFDIEDADEEHKVSLDKNTLFAERYVFPYMKVLKKCIPSNNECWSDTIYNLDGAIVNSLIANSTPTRVSFITPSGYSIFYWLHGNATAGGTGGHFLIDVNGPKKPNTLGKDIFWFGLNWGATSYKRGLYPNGLIEWEPLTREELINDGGYGCKEGGGTYAGGYCAALLMTDNWDIKSDYPW